MSKKAKTKGRSAKNFESMLPVMVPETSPSRPSRTVWQVLTRPTRMAMHAVLRERDMEQRWQVAVAKANAEAAANPRGSATDELIRIWEMEQTAKARRRAAP